ncbi:two-component system sensor histidine kinase NtrB [Nereida ignava]|uniref:two-component system sensor histidine kinase NtrB n=1 Tax=Nereida ignava TaxID=282199 RepID=UPI0030FA588F
MDRALWISLPSPVVLIGADDCVIDMNPAGESFLNVSCKSLIGKSLWDTVLRAAPMEGAMQKARSSHSTLYINDVIVGDAGKGGMAYNIQVAPLQGTEGGMIMLMSPRELTTRIDTSRTSHSAARSAIGMSEMLAHEIKNPLAGITGAAQLLSMNLSNGDREMTDLIVEETRRIVKLLDQVEMFGNLQPPEQKVVNIHDVLNRARRSALVGFGAHMTIAEHYDPSLPSTLGDADQLLQVIQNLLKNASEAADRRGGHIDIRTYYEHSLRVRRADGEHAPLPLQIEIIDDGPGLPPELENDIFEPFVSGKENGTGLGLALVAKIVADHHGWLRVESEPGKTMFRISLPRAPKHMKDQTE